MLTRRKTISFRLTLWFGSIFLLGWMLFGAAMWFNLWHTLTNERQLTLSRRIDRLQTLLNKIQGESSEDRYEDYKDFARATGGGLVEVLYADGSRAFRDPSEAAKDFPWPSSFKPGDESFQHVRAVGQPYWVLARPDSLAGKPVYLVAAAPEAANLLVLTRFWEGLLASVPVLLLISSAGGYWLSRNALRPVDRITAMARSISIRNLSERLPQTRTADELERLTETINAMLERLESAVGQIKQFTADASHELRGPLSFVRTVAEVALRNGGTDQNSREAFEDIVAETAKASVLLGDMLTLARAEAERGGMVFEQVDLSAVVKEACEVARPMADERRLSLTTAEDPGKSVTVLGDFSTLRRLMWILLDNALKFTPAPGSIDVVVTSDFRHATVTVRDTGAGISDKDLPHIFDRFYRADPSRSQTEGSGLGLAIAKWIAEVHNADLSVTSQTGKGSAFQLVMPVYSPS